MSWNFSVPSQPAESFDPAAARASYEQVISEAGGEHISEETSAQIDAALAAAVAIIKSGAVGSENVVVNVGGHANPGHTSVAGWANDVISLTVAFEPTPVEPEPAVDAADRVTELDAENAELRAQLAAAEPAGEVDPNAAAGEQPTPLS